MKSRIKSLIAFSLFACASVASAQPLECKAYPQENIKTAALQETGYWWKYFEGSYADMTKEGGVTSFGNLTFPATLNIAMKLSCSDPDLQGRTIKGVSFLFWDYSNVDNIIVWLSNKLPETPQQSTICAYSIKKDNLTAGRQMALELLEPYKITSKDVYIGYQFVQTSDSPWPIAIDKQGIPTKDGAFYCNINAAGWGQITPGKPYGNPALAAYIVCDMGDANNDGYVDVLDVASTIDYVLNKSDNVVNIYSADIDGNGEVNIVDVESIVDIIIEKYKEPVPDAAAYASDMLMAEKTDEGFSLKLNADNEYRGFQMDVVLPASADIKDIALDASIAATHSIKYVRLEGSRYRVIVSSMNGTSFNTDNLINILSSANDMRIENIVFATSDLQEKRFDKISIGDATAIENVSSEDNRSDIHNINGVKVNSDNLVKGVYIVNGKKVIIK